MYARLHPPCIHHASGQRHAAERIPTGRLPVFQRKDTDRKCGRFTRCSISSFVTAGLWLRSGFRGGRVSETKGNALAREDRIKAVVIAVCSSTGCHQVL